MFALSQRSRMILELLAKGAPDCRDVSLNDLTRAARQALLLDRSVRMRQQRAHAVLRHYPRAFEKWSEYEDKQLCDLYGSGKTLREIAARLQRQPGAIKARLAKLAR